MSATTHRLRVNEARRIKHPNFPEIEKHFFLVAAADLPDGIRTDANARDPVGLNRRVYREVKESLLGRDSTFPGTFDLMNKGITILADRVKRIDDNNYELTVNDGQGIVDGGHTYKIITESQDDPDLQQDQYVQIQAFTGIAGTIVADIARGLNTGIQVKQHSLDALDGKYDWIKEELENQPYIDRIAWNESDLGEYDVRDLICVMEALNIWDFPNEGGNHPVQAYEKWSVPTQKFAKDFDEHEFKPTTAKYYRMRPILCEALVLYDRIRRDFRDIYNGAQLGQAGKLSIVEEAKGKRMFSFPFANLPDSKYRLTKGAAYPIFAAFRNKVVVDPESGDATWNGGFSSVLSLWEYAAPEICRATKLATQDISNRPDVIGKNRGHWSNMHKTVELFILRQELAARRAS